jgi:hypothetical protein
LSIIDVTSNSKEAYSFIAARSNTFFVSIIKHRITVSIDAHDVNFATVIGQQFEASAVKNFETVAFAFRIADVHGVYVNWQLTSVSGSKRSLHCKTGWNVSTGGVCSLYTQKAKKHQ